MVEPDRLEHCLFTSSPGARPRLRVHRQRPGRPYPPQPARQGPQGRKLTGDEAEWVALDVLHQAVALLAADNDDPTHLFGHKGMTSNSLVLFGSVNRRLNGFRDHLRELLSAPDARSES